MFLRGNRAGCLTCVLESFFFLFLFCFFVPKLKWKERESQVGMDTWHDIKHGILVLYLEIRNYLHNVQWSQNCLFIKVLSYVLHQESTLQKCLVYFGSPSWNSSSLFFLYTKKVIKILILLKFYKYIFLVSFNRLILAQWHWTTSLNIDNLICKILHAQNSSLSDEILREQLVIFTTF